MGKDKAIARQQEKQETAELQIGCKEHQVKSEHEATDTGESEQLNETTGAKQRRQQN